MLEGTISVTGNVIRILQATPVTIEQLARLQELLKNANRNRQSPEEVAAAVTRESPHLAELAKQLLIPRTASDFYALLTFLIVVIGMLRDEPQKVHEDRSQIINQVIEQVYTNPPPALQTPPSKSAKPGRNAPCPCGSNKKYKHCCGALR
jgi:hypothetical protein